VRYGTANLIGAPADGYTLLVASAANAINATLYRNLKFDFIRDTEPIARIARTPLVMCIHPSFQRGRYPSSLSMPGLILAN
jgi:tripartite-type tricarboxylate transporter receptor subunit TctC